MDDAELACYERIGSLRAYIRRPKLLLAGNVMEFFVPVDSPDSDLALMLGRSGYNDSQVCVTLHLIKDADGKDLRQKEKADPDVKPYNDIAMLLYRKGYFNAPHVQRAIGEPAGGVTGQSKWGIALARKLGFDSMGMVPPDVMFEWAEKHDIEDLLPDEYKPGRPE